MQDHSPKHTESEKMTNPPQLKFNLLNLEFALIEGLNKMCRGSGLRRKGHYLLLPMPLLIQSINKLLFKFMNCLPISFLEERI